jgi:hypothetical protein
MRIKFLLNLVAIGILVVAGPLCVAAQNVRDAGDTELIQYYVLFRRLVHPPPARNRPPSESPNQNNQSNQAPPDFRAMLHRSLKLSETEARLLDQIAEDCLSKTDKLDQQALEIISAFRADVAAGKTPPTAQPPSSLQDLQAQRDGAIRNAIEQLRVQFGAAEFKRVNDLLLRTSGVSSMQLPVPTQKALPIEVKFALVNGDVSARQRFSAKDSFTIEVSMLNNSTEMISIKPSQLYQWLLLTKSGDKDDALRPVPRNMMFSDEWMHPPADEAAVDLPPNQLLLVARFKFGAGGIHFFKPTEGEYQLSIHPKVVYERPPKSDFLQLTLSSPFTFEIVP